MKFTFQADLPHQTAAIDSIVALFKGQEAQASQFTVQARPDLADALDVAVTGVETTGFGNNLRLTDDRILANLQEIQKHNGLHVDDELGPMNFTVEMETGTGKTYVYLRTIYELNEKYGFTKFVIVVPSVAINEGVASSIRMLKDHFETLYPGVPMQHFQYSGNNVSRLRSFATSSGIEIMIVTAAAINKATAKIHKQDESIDYEVGMDLIRAVSPIVIVDEPQSVYGDDGRAGGKKGAGRVAIEGDNTAYKKALKEPDKPAALSLAKGMAPAAVIRYSATHPKHDENNLVYRLDAIDAYGAQLVKQIEVDSLVTESSGVKPYIKLLDVKRTGQNMSARLELDTEVGGSVKRKGHWVKLDRNLADVTGREVYRDFILNAISVVSGGQYVRFTENTELKPGDSIGDEVGLGERARQMIAQTIRQHLRKELNFKQHDREIKVLSLFFVDSVAKYRDYNENNDAQPGEYARIFEEEYVKVASEGEFQTLFGGRNADTQELAATARGAHQGYFSIDRAKGGVEKLVDTTESNDKGRQAAGLAYEQIMKDKVGLTTPGTPIRFVFSHSALQEGWDNPNVFQICVLRNMGTERWRRQSIGRGLRLCVDGNGDRLKGFDLNCLTVIANESYEEFAEQLQRELSDDLGIQFGVVTVEGFSRLMFKPAGKSEPEPVGEEVAKAIFETMKTNGWINGQGKVEDPLRLVVENDIETVTRAVELHLPDPIGANAVTRLIKRIAKPIDVKRAGTRMTVPVVADRLESREFADLWERIRRRTRYRLTVAEETLRDALVKSLRDVSVPKRKGSWRTERVKWIDQSGIGSEGTEQRVDITFADSENLPDILSLLADRTQLTRRTLAETLAESGTLHQFKDNPQAYLDEVTTRITNVKSRLLVDGLHYDLVDEDRPEDERTYPLSIFEEADLSGYTGTGGNIVMDEHGDPISFEAKSPYKFVVTDSKTEKDFALGLRSNNDVKAFVKLPSAFTIPTPLGTYNPDWAVMAERKDGSRYIVFETKGTADIDMLPVLQKGKVMAAKQHFNAVRVDVQIPAQYVVIDKASKIDAALDRADDLLVQEAD